MELTIKLRRDSAQNWTTINPVLHEGEAGVELETKKMKLGDGVTVWNSLPYVNVIPNADITGATHTKITYDSKGLVTGGEDITLSDVTDITASAAEVNVLDGITATTTELNYVDGVTSNIQTQLNNKQPTGNYVTTDTAQDITAKKTFQTSTWNGGLTAKRTTTGSSFVVFENSDNVLGGVGLSPSSVPISTDRTNQNAWAIVRGGAWNNPAVGNSSTPVYVDSNGIAKECENVATKDEIPTANDYWTVNTDQTTTGRKTISYTASGNQDNGFKVLGNQDNASFTTGWVGRVLIGTNKNTFLMGVNKKNGNFMCGLGAHSWTDAAQQTGAAWQDMYFNPDGAKTMYFGGSGWTINSGWLKVQNDGTTSAASNNKVYLNLGTNTSPTWKAIQPIIEGAASTVTTSNLTPLRLLISDGNGKIAASSNITTTEASYLDGVTSNIQTQLDNKVNVKPDGTNNLITNNKVADTYLPDYLFGQMIYAGGFVPSTAVATLTTNAKKKLGTQSNTITLTNDTTPITGYVANEGCYYICTADGTFAGVSLLTGDWLVSTGSAWTKVDNTDAVTGVKGNAETTYRLGNVNITIDNVAPDQTNNSGKVLTTNGTNASWTDIPVEDVQIDSTSIVSNGVANIPVAGATTLGVIKCGGYGLQMMTGGVIQLVPASDSVIEAKTNGYNPLTPNKIDLIVKSGLVNNTQVMSVSDKQSATDWILPSQTDNSGKVLRTDGTNASWGYSAIIREWQD